MILSLHIKNIALIQELDLELSQGLNILSGETGAGKSIIIDSLNFVLGERADRSLIRHGEKTATVQVTFSNDNNSKLSATFDECGIVDDDIIIVHRTMTESGKSECRVNGTLINLFNLRRIVAELVDIHSQHEHQSLLIESNHIKILDNYIPDIEEIKKDFNIHLTKYRDALKEIETFPSADARERQLDILDFQLNEIAKADIKDGEEEDLLLERAKINNYQKIAHSLLSVQDGLSGDSNFSVAVTLYNAIKELASISQYDTDIASLADRIESAKIELDDIADSIKAHADNSFYDELELEAVEKRINTIRSIKKRYGQSISEIKDFYNKVKAEYDKLQNAEQIIDNLNKIVDTESKVVIRLLHKMHSKRVQAAKIFESEIIKNLHELGMLNSTFKVEIILAEDEADVLSAANENGADAVRFLISPNKGEPLKPLAKIASGGEMSRFMLGLKNITAELEGIDTLVFDEIDTGISGKIAKVVASKLYDIARKRQVIAVTHLPQLASMADTHYLISKSDVGEKTITSVNKLSAADSLKEIMRLSGSMENSVVGLESAKELKRWAESWKKGK